MPKPTRLIQSVIEVATQFELVPLARLVPVDWNPQEHPRDMLDRLKASITRHGMLVPIIARPSDGSVAGGHGRLIVLEELVAEGYELPGVPVIWREVSDQELYALNLALNNAQGHAEPELVAKALQMLLAEHDGDDLLPFIGIGTEEVQDYLTFAADLEAMPSEHEPLPFTKRLPMFLPIPLADFDTVMNALALVDPDRSKALLAICEAYEDAQG